MTSLKYIIFISITIWTSYCNGLVKETVINSAGKKIKDVDIPQLDDMIDSLLKDELDDLDIKTTNEIKCAVTAKRPYGVSPIFKLTGIHEKFNGLLIGYDTHNDEKRANKGSLYGWSSSKMPDENGEASFRMDLDYVTVLPQSGIPLSYCALIFVPPIEPKFDIRFVFGKPALSVERYIGSEEHFVKALKRKGRKVTSCCFVAYPMVSKR